VRTHRLTEVVYGDGDQPVGVEACDADLIDAAHGHLPDDEQSAIRLNERDMAGVLCAGKIDVTMPPVPNVVSRDPSARSRTTVKSRAGMSYASIPVIRMRPLASRVMAAP
jgi:hypothetical protein